MNTTESAVRIVHDATGVVGFSQSHRCQHRNKKEALIALRRNLALYTPPSVDQESRESRDEQSTTLSPDQAQAVSYLFRKNASKKDPLFYEGTKILLQRLRQKCGALKCVNM